MIRRLVSFAILVTVLPGQRTKNDELADLKPGTLELTRTQNNPGDVVILTIPCGDTDRFRLLAIVGAGSRDDPDNAGGIANLVGESLSNSTAGNSSKTLAQQLLARDASVRVLVTHETTTLSIDAPAKSWDFAVKWLTETLSQPAFESAEIETTREGILDQLDRPGGPTEAAVRNATLYPRHPLGRPVLGTSASVAAISPMAVAGFYERYYLKSNILIAFSGRVPVDQCKAAINVGLTHLESGTTSHRPVRNPATDELRYIDPLYGSGSAEIEIGYHLPNTSTEDLPHQLILHQLVRRSLAEAGDLVLDSETELHLHRDLPRLSLTAFADPASLYDVVGQLRRAVELAADPTPEQFVRARDAVFETLQAGDLASMSRAAHLCRQFELVGGHADQLIAALKASDRHASTTQYAQRHLMTEHQRYLLRSTPPGSPLLFPILLGLLLLFLSTDALRGFPIAHRLAAFLKIQRARQQVAMERAAIDAQVPPDPVSPVSGDELEQSIQDYFSEQDNAGR